MCKITHERETIFLNLLPSENRGWGAGCPLDPRLMVRVIPGALRLQYALLTVLCYMWRITFSSDFFDKRLMKRFSICNLSKKDKCFKGLQLVGSVTNYSDWLTINS